MAAQDDEEDDDEVIAVDSSAANMPSFGVADVAFIDTEDNAPEDAGEHPGDISREKSSNSAAKPAKALTPDEQRLIAAAAAARGLQPVANGSESDSDSSSSSSDSSASKAPKAQAPNSAAQGSGPAPAAPARVENGTALPKAAEPASREALLSAIFRDLEEFCGTAGRATLKAMQRFVTMVGFDGSDNEWRAEYLSLCKEWQMDPEKGFDKDAFSKMVNDKTASGCYCSDTELKSILGKLLAAPKKVQSASRRTRKQPNAAKGQPPAKKQKQ